MKRLSRFRELFLQIFRAPKDIHRVVSALYLGVLFSHVYFIWASPSKAGQELSRAISVLVFIVSIPIVYQFLWTLFNSELNIKLYFRQIAVAGWGVLAHRLTYEVESSGSTFTTVMFIIGWSAWLPFLLSGARFDYLQTKIEDWQDAKKNNYLMHDGGVDGAGVYTRPEPDSKCPTIRPN